MSELARLLVLALAVLAVATLVGRILRRVVARGAPHPVIDDLNARIASWWVMVALLAAAFAIGPGGVIALFALLSMLALREYASITYTRRGDHFALALGFFVAIPAQYGLVALGWYGLYSILIPVYAFLLLPIASALRGDPTRFLRRVAATQWGLMLCVYGLSHVPALLTLEIPGFEARGMLLVAFVLIVVQASDVLQYVWGKLVGGPRLAPTLSPSKTVSGLVGGIASATALGAMLWWLTPFGAWMAAGMALLVAALGAAGGLVMSAIKRDHGIKDWGHLIPGHGGVLDRLDSVVFAAPVFFHLTRYLYT
jgi:phosphatidate cytidylyltransferase